MGKEKLVKRLKQYYPLERFHAFFTFPFLTVYFIIKNPFLKSIWFVYGMLICIFILYQGQKYWKLKLWRLQNKPFSESENIKFFRSAKRSNGVLLMVSPMILIVQILIVDWTAKDFNIIYWSALANIFALLEYVNYYHTQLMIDNNSDFQYIVRNRRLKTPSLAKDLKENRI